MKRKIIIYIKLLIIFIIFYFFKFNDFFIKIFLSYKYDIENIENYFKLLS